MDQPDQGQEDLPAPAGLGDRQAQDRRHPAEGVGSATLGSQSPPGPGHPQVIPGADLPPGLPGHRQQRQLLECPARPT